MCPGFLCALLLLLSGCATYNAATGRNEVIWISTSSEVSMGRDVHREISSKYKVIEEGQEFDRLNRIGQRVARVSDRQDFQYHFYLVESDEINAFTVPGGNVYFFTGLFRKMPSDDTIAAVLAHEVGHSAAKHTVKKFQAAMGYNVVRDLVMNVLAVKAPQAKTIAQLGADGVMGLSMSAYGRHDEYEADKLGIKYLYLAGYDLNAMIKTFEILQENSKGDHTPLILRTHPFIKDRMEAAKKEIESVKQTL